MLEGCVEIRYSWLYSPAFPRTSDLVQRCDQCPHSQRQPSQHHKLHHAEDTDFSQKLQVIGLGLRRAMQRKISNSVHTRFIPLSDCKTFLGVSEKVMLSQQETTAQIWLADWQKSPDLVISCASVILVLNSFHLLPFLHCCSPCSCLYRIQQNLMSSNCGKIIFHPNLEIWSYIFLKQE